MLDFNYEIDQGCQMLEETPIIKILTVTAYPTLPNQTVPLAATIQKQTTDFRDSLEKIFSGNVSNLELKHQFLKLLMSAKRHLHLQQIHLEHLLIDCEEAQILREIFVSSPKLELVKISSCSFSQGALELFSAEVEKYQLHELQLVPEKETDQKDLTLKFVNSMSSIRKLTYSSGGDSNFIKPSLSLELTNLYSFRMYHSVEDFSLLSLGILSCKSLLKLELVKVNATDEALAELVCNLSIQNSLSSFSLSAALQNYAKSLMALADLLGESNLRHLRLVQDTEARMKSSEGSIEGFIFKLAEISSNLETLVVSHVDFASYSTDVICNILSFPMLQTMILRRVVLNSSQISSFSRLWEKRGNLRTLVLEQLDGDDLNRLLRNSLNLTRLILLGQKLKNGQLMEVFENLSNNHTLLEFRTAVSPSINSVIRDTMSSFSKCLEANQTLRILELRDLSIPKPLLNLLQSSMERNTTLIHFDGLSFANTLQGHLERNRTLFQQQVYIALLCIWKNKAEGDVNLVHFILSFLEGFWFSRNQIKLFEDDECLFY
jgi:hypothetical protein